MTAVFSHAAISAFSAKNDDFTPFASARNWIDGKWCDPATSQAVQEIVNPRYGKSIAQVRMGGADDVDLAAQSAACVAVSTPTV